MADPDAYLWSVEIRIPEAQEYDLRKVYTGLNTSYPDVRVEVSKGCLNLVVQVNEPLRTMNNEKMQRYLGDAIPLILDTLQRAYVGPLERG